MTGRIPPSHIPVVGQDGRMTPAWYRYFAKSEDLEPGTITAGAGLTGGGPVSEGVSISVPNNGIGNAQLRDSLGCSVIGRFQNSTGDPGDIQATANFRVLSREGDVLSFRRLRAESFTVAGVPNAVASGSGAIVYVSNEAGGAVLAFSDGTNWLRVTDRAIIS